MRNATELYKLLVDVAEQLLQYGEDIDGEWGMMRDGPTLAKDGAMPDIYYQLMDEIQEREP